MTFVNHVYLARFGVEIQEKVVVEKGKLIDSGVDGQRFQLKLFRADGFIVFILKIKFNRNSSCLHLINSLISAI